MFLDYQTYKFRIHFIICHLPIISLFSNAQHGKPLHEGDEVSTNGSVTNQVQQHIRRFLISVNKKYI